VRPSEKSYLSRALKDEQEFDREKKWEVDAEVDAEVSTNLGYSALTPITLRLGLQPQ
jgi:hypothetical protein